MVQDPQEKKPLQLPPDSRGFILVVSPFIVAYGIWMMVTGRLAGRHGQVVEGAPAYLVGAMFAGVFAILFAIAWSERGRGDH